MLLLLQVRDALQQALGVFVGRVVEDIVGEAAFDHLAGVHDGDAVAGAGHDAQVVGNEYDGHAQPILKIHDKLQDLGLDGDVQRRGGLVGDKQLGLAGQGDGDHDALTHAAGELVGVLLETLIGLVDTHQSQQLPRAVVGFLLGLVGVQQYDLANLVADGVDGVQAGHGVLEDY